MKILHISDLHFGKSIYGLSLIDSGDQLFWADRFMELVQREQPQAVIIAGDVYDRSAPSDDANKLWDDFVTRLTQITKVLVVAGNHDSGQKLSVYGDLVERSGVYIAGKPSARLRKVTLEDEYGPVHFWLMPYMFPAMVNSLLGTEYREYGAAIAGLLAAQDMDTAERNVIAAHQNVTALGEEAERGGSETMIGGVGGIDYTVFDAFEYAALGHIHAAQAMGRPEVRYAGSPLCYHFSETKYPEKGPVLVELGPKGTPVSIRVCPLPALHPMREVAGTAEEVLADARGTEARNEYIRVVLRGEKRGAEIEAGIRAMYEGNGSRVLDFARESLFEAGPETCAAREAVEQKSMEELFADFCEERSGAPRDEADRALVRFILERMENEGRGQELPSAADIGAIVRAAGGKEAAE